MARLDHQPPYLTTKQFAGMSNAEAALHIAASKVGERETWGANWSPFIKTILAVAGLFSPNPWCAAFVYWCLVEAGADKSKLWKYPASTASLLSWAKANNRLRMTGKRGDLFIYNHVTRLTGHTGFITNVENGGWDTIEGNTNVAGSREGIGVFRRHRTLHELQKAAGSASRAGAIDLTGI